MTRLDVIHPRDVAMDEHPRLREVVDRIRTTLAARQATREFVAEMLQDLTVQVLEHFRHEETGGYFASALEAAPHLTGRADELLSQHPRMAAILAELVDYSAQRVSSPRWWREVNVRFTSFLALFVAHEAGENGLLQEAVNEDVGTVD
jgi:hypothetical protein